MINIEIKGFNRVQNKMRKFAATMPRNVQQVIHKWGQKTRAKLKGWPYPPRRPRQKYVRTGNLANSWKAVDTRHGVSIDNTATYARYVVGDNQAWMHKGRWWQARPLIEDSIPALTLELTKEIEKSYEQA